MSKPWSSEELDILRNMYPNNGINDYICSLLPNRSPNSIRLKANKLGLQVINNIRASKKEDYIDFISNSSFELLEEYAGSTSPILHKCNVCGHVWKVRPQQLLRGGHCTNCHSKLLPISEVDSLLEAKGFIRCSEYTGSLKEVVLKHKYCGYTWTTKYSYIQQGSGCPICNGGFGYITDRKALPETASLYLLAIATDEEEFYKVGVTVRDINTRIRELRSRLGLDSFIQVEHLINDSGRNVLLKESNILNKFLKYYSNVKFEGCTELLDISNNILDIKKEMNEIIQ